MTQAQKLADFSQALMVSPLAFRNRLINGSFIWNQRQYVTGTATSGPLQYTLDRWRVVTSGQSLTYVLSGTDNIVTAPAGGIEQVIEGLFMEGGDYTLSWTGTATATVNGTAVANGAYINLPANTNATVRFSGGTVSLAQLEPGRIVTVFERRMGIELTLCQRYYETGFLPVTYMAGVNTTAYMDPFRFAVPKRVAPTITYSGVQYYSSGNPTAISTNISTVGIDTTVACMYINGGMTNCNGIAGGSFAASAEL